MTALLASVTDLGELETALKAGVDILDLKTDFRLSVARSRSICRSSPLTSPVEWTNQRIPATLGRETRG